MGEELALGILAATEAAHFFSAFNPSIFTIKRFPDEQTKKDIIAGCVLATTFGMGIVFAAAYIAKSYKPLLFGIPIIALMDVIYIYTASTAKTQ
ncbi:MAG TPA: hypothetical protein PK390_06715 [Fervidobacterium nodosum]|nr:hypothetical protein [Fervidobacterium nodosum]